MIQKPRTSAFIARCGAFLYISSFYHRVKTQNFASQLAGMEDFHRASQLGAMASIDKSSSEMGWFRGHAEFHKPM